MFDNVSHFPDLLKFSSSLSRALINDLNLCVHRGGTKNVEGVSFHRTSSQLASPYLQIFGSSSGGEGNIAAHRGDKLGESNC